MGLGCLSVPAVSSEGWEARASSPGAPGSEGYKNYRFEPGLPGDCEGLFVKGERAYLVGSTLT